MNYTPSDCVIQQIEHYPRHCVENNGVDADFSLHKRVQTRLDLQHLVTDSGVVDIIVVYLQAVD